MKTGINRGVLQSDKVSAKCLMVIRIFIMLPKVGFVSIKDAVFISVYRAFACQWAGGIVLGIALLRAVPRYIRQESD